VEVSAAAIPAVVFPGAAAILAVAVPPETGKIAVSREG
jgi:hypothetical protein